MPVWFHPHPRGEPCTRTCQLLKLEPPPPRVPLFRRAWQAYTTRPRVTVAVNLAALVLGILIGQISSRL